MSFSFFRGTRSPRPPPPSDPMKHSKFTACLSTTVCLMFMLTATGKAAVDGPQLNISFSQEAISVEWPLDAADWVLENSPKLNSPIQWSRIAPSLYQINGVSFIVTLAPSAGNLFFRLRKMDSSSPAVPGLTGTWGFDDGQGLLAQDTSGYGNPASLSNVSWVAGRIGSGALRFNGGMPGASSSSAWVSNTNYRVLPGQGQPFSVSFWFSPDALTNGWSGLIGNDGNGSNGWHLALHNSGPGTNELVFASGGPGSLNVTGRKLLLPGRWYHLSASYDGNQGTIYVDSELLGQGTGTLAGNDQAIYFGGGIGGDNSFLGLIDDIRIYTN